MHRAAGRGSHAHPGSGSRHVTARPSPYGVRDNHHSRHVNHHGNHHHYHQAHRHGREPGQQPGGNHGPQPNQPSKCNICSYSQPYPSEQIPVHHNHFSSLRLREFMGVETSGQGYYCPSCKSRHRPYLDERLKVVVSDSSLHHFFAPPDFTGPRHYEGDLVHADYVTIAEATLPDLYHAFRLDYEHQRNARPLDVVVVAGYADLVQGYAREYILDGFRTFTDMVTALNKENTVAIATLMLPPKLAWLPDDGPQPYRYTNILEKIEWLNKKIHDINKKNNVPYYPGFHFYGTRKNTTTYIDSDGKLKKKETRTHRWEHWEQLERRNMLYLRSHRRFKMGKAIIITSF